MRFTFAKFKLGSDASVVVATPKEISGKDRVVIGPEFAVRAVAPDPRHDVFCSEGFCASRVPIDKPFEEFQPDRQVMVEPLGVLVAADKCELELGAPVILTDGPRTRAGFATQTGFVNVEQLAESHHV